MKMNQFLTTWKQMYHTKSTKYNQQCKVETIYKLTVQCLLTFTLIALKIIREAQVLQIVHPWIVLLLAASASLRWRRRRRRKRRAQLDSTSSQSSAFGSWAQRCGRRRDGCGPQWGPVRASRRCCSSSESVQNSSHICVREVLHWIVLQASVQLGEYIFRNSINL